MKRDKDFEIRLKQSRENFERIQKRISPFIKPKGNENPPEPEVWYDAYEIY